MENLTETAVGRELRCRGALCGAVTFVVWDPERDAMTGLVVQPEGHEAARVVPARRVTRAGGGLEFDGTLAEFQKLDEPGTEPLLCNTERPLADRADHILVRTPSASPRGRGGPP